jgi:two-component sensor histidine kinase
MDADKIIQHLLNISKGECEITEESILKRESEEDQMIELGLLTLFEEVEYNKRKLTKANKEKEVLLQEIHHRVKNNLQIISSLLSLQSDVVDNDEAVAILRDSRSRVNTMAVIHEKLYRSSDLGSVDYKDYVEELVEQLKIAHSTPPTSTTSLTANEQRPKIEFSIPSIMLTLNTAIPLGLLLNEILTNSFKYGRDDEGKLEIYINIEEIEPLSFVIEIGDFGLGFAEEIFETGQNTLGVQLIRDLTSQLDGTIEKVARPGTNYRIKFEVEDE